MLLCNGGKLKRNRICQCDSESPSETMAAQLAMPARAVTSKTVPVSHSLQGRIKEVSSQDIHDERKEHGASTFHIRVLLDSF